MLNMRLFAAITALFASIATAERPSDWPAAPFGIVPTGDWPAAPSGIIPTAWPTAPSGIIPTDWPTASAGIVAPYPTAGLAGSPPYPTAASSGFVLSTASGAPYPTGTGVSSSSGYSSSTG